MSEILHSRPWITSLDRQAISDVLRSGMLAQGKLVELLEAELSEWVSAAGGVAVGSGSAAILLALQALDIEPTDEVILPTYVCGSVYEAVLSSNATPVLCDVGDDWVVTAESVTKKITNKTKAIIVPHIYGIFSDIEALSKLGLVIIEDCAQAVDAKMQRKSKADITIFSLHPTKCITSGEGGVAVSNSAELIKRMRTYRDGSQQLNHTRIFSPLSDISASLALAQLAHYSIGLKRRKKIAEAYIRVFNQINPSFLNVRANQNSMFFRFPIRIQGGLDAYQNSFSKQGIHIRRGVDVLLHRKLGLDDHDYQNAVKHFETTISLPIYPALTKEEKIRCVDSIRLIFS